MSNSTDLTQNDNQDMIDTVLKGLYSFNDNEVVALFGAHTLGGVNRCTGMGGIHG